MSIDILDDQKIIQNRRKLIPNLSKYFWITFIICTIYVIQDIFTRDYFFDASNEVTLFVMDHTGSGYEWFNRRISTISMLADALMIAYVFWITPRQIDSLYLIIVTVLSLFQMTFLKSLYRDPRPYFVDLDIKTTECGPEFGNPSGHGVNNLVLVYVSHFIADNDCFHMIVRNEEGKFKLHQRRFWINLIGLILCILIGWARVCLGMHSLNQVLLGWVLGVIWIIVFLCVFYKRFRFYWAEIMKEEGFTRRKKTLLVTLIAIYAFITGMCCLVYEMNKKHFDIPEMWIKGIEQTCQKEFDEDLFHRSLFHKTFSDMGVFGATFGVMIGILFMTGSYDEKKIYENYSKMPKKLFLLRVLSDVILLALSFGIPWASVQFIGAEHIYPRFFIGYNLASFLAGFTLVLLRPKFFKLFRCQVEGDMNYQIQNSTKKVVVLIEDIPTQESSTKENSNQGVPLKEKNELQQSPRSKIAFAEQQNTMQTAIKIQIHSDEAVGHKNQQNTNQIKSESNINA